MIRRTISYKEPKISLYKTLVRPHVEYWSCAWNPHYRKDKELLEKIQRRYTKIINDMKGKTYEERLRCLRLWTLEERRNRQDLIEVFKMYRGFSSIPLHRLFILDTNSKGTRGHTCKVVKTRCTRDITKYFFQARSSTGGICWTNGRWMHPVSTHSSRDCAISGTTGWAFSWTSPLSPRPCWLHRLPVRLHRVNHKVKLIYVNLRTQTRTARTRTGTSKVVN